jgi:hypothetical protein
MAERDDFRFPCVLSPHPEERARQLDQILQGFQNLRDELSIRHGRIPAIHVFLAELL